jgi:hypothetical protein
MTGKFLLVPALLCALLGEAQTTDTSLVSSVNQVSGNTDSASSFFSIHEKIDKDAWPSVKLVSRNRKSTNLHAVLNDPEKTYHDHVLADLDGDGIKELVVSLFTGGAHCCDEILIFRQTAPGKYTHAARVFAGHSLFSANNELVFTFYEHFGYFFTCYACGLTDTSDTAPIDIRAIVLRYGKGGLRVKPGDQELRSAVMDNLGKLSEMPYEELGEDVLMDHGLRKEFAMNLAVYYYSFGKNLVDTRALFRRYYKFPDSAKVWSAFVKQLKEVQAGNDF